MTKPQFLLEKLTKLEKLFLEKEEWLEGELMEWYKDSVVLLEEIDLREKLINDLSLFFNTHLLQQSNAESSLFIVTGSPTVFRTKTTSLHMATIRNTFGFAKKKIELMEEEEKIIPSFIIEYFNVSQSYGHIFTALNSIDDSQKDRNIVAMMASANTLLDSILDDVSELKGKNLGAKLELLGSDFSLTKRLGFDQEIILAFNNSRIIRNVELIHPKKNVVQSVPYICAVSFAYLVVLQLKIMMSIGYFDE